MKLPESYYLREHLDYSGSVTYIQTIPDASRTVRPLLETSTTFQSFYYCKNHLYTPLSLHHAPSPRSNVPVAQIRRRLRLRVLRIATLCAGVA